MPFTGNSFLCTGGFNKFRTPFKGKSWQPKGKKGYGFRATIGTALKGRRGKSQGVLPSDQCQGGDSGPRRQKRQCHGGRATGHTSSEIYLRKELRVNDSSRLPLLSKITPVFSMVATLRPPVVLNLIQNGVEPNFPVPKLNIRACRKSKEEELFALKVLKEYQQVGAAKEVQIKDQTSFCSGF